MLEEINYLTSKQESGKILAWRYRQPLYQYVAFKNEAIMESRMEKRKDPYP